MFLCQVLLGLDIKEDELSRTCNTCEKEEVPTKFCLGTLKKRDNFEKPRHG
jgi:hypothetical protein